jgi:hypothetical protein
VLYCFGLLPAESAGRVPGRLTLGKEWSIFFGYLWIFKKTLISKFTKIIPEGAELSQADRQT